MIEKFSEDEMVEIWKRRLGLTASAGLELTHDDNRLDRKIREDIKIWYARLLQEAPPELVNCEDVAAECRVTAKGDNCAQIQLPDRAVKVVSVKMADWDLPEHRTWSPYSNRARLQMFVPTRATPETPVVVEIHRTLYAHGLKTGLYAADFEARRSENSGQPPEEPEEDEVPYTTGYLSFFGADVPPYRPVPDLESLYAVAFPADGSYAFDSMLIERIH